MYLSVILCCAKSLSRVGLFMTPWPVAHQAPLPMGILQARILEWVPMPSSRGSSKPRGRTQISCYSTITENEIMQFAATWLDLEIIILSEVSQKERDKYHITSMWNLKYDTNESMKQKQPWRRDLWLPRGRG